MSVNKHGLGRHIPADVARAVRQRDGFGCVVCGLAIYEYEHINPEFSEATEHCADGIVLLCDGCHRKKGKFLAVSSILKCAQNPKAKQVGFSFGPFDVSNDHPKVSIGPLRAECVNSIIEVDGKSLFSIASPEAQGGPFRLNAALFDRHGEPTFEIVDNEWRVLRDNWDVEVIGSRIWIRSGKGDVALCLRSEPPDRVVVEKLNLAYGSTTIQAEEGGEIVVTTSAGTQMVASGIDLFGCDKALEISQHGLAIGVGGGSMYIHSMMVNSGVIAGPRDCG